VILAILAVILQWSKSVWAVPGTTLETIIDDNKNCTHPAIDEFPRDFFTQEQRTKGGVIIHVLLATYLIFALGAICDDFFVPVLEVICDKLHLSNDVAGATFMAAGTSAPEFFTNIMGTFVTKSDLGIGTIVGSAVFNIFGVISVCGLFSGQKIPLDWYPITRDCFIYGITVVILSIVLVDETVFWWEAMMMVVCYGVYITLMFFNVKIERWAQSLVKTVKKRVYPSATVNGNGAGTGADNSSSVSTQTVTNELTPLHTATSKSRPSNNIPMTVTNESTPLHTANSKSTRVTEESSEAAAGAGYTQDDVIKLEANGHGVVEDDPDDDDDESPGYPWEIPSGILAKIWWLCFFPVNILFFLSIPDVRRPKCVKWFPLSFLMCIAWIGVVAYEVTWLITVIGYTIQVPDTVMGLSFLAVGTSIPEVFSSLIVSKQGKGSMAVSNSIGSNTFDILICLGLPWMIRAIQTGVEHDIWIVKVQSEALTYTVVSLLISLIILYSILLASRFLLSRTLGFVTLIIYGVFLTISLLFELNVFYEVNLPTCPSKFS